MLGIIARHLASLITLFGMALSGVAIISVKTLADASIRFSISDLSLSSSADQPMAENSNTMVLNTTTNFGTPLDRFIWRPFFRAQLSSATLFVRPYPNFRVGFVPSGSPCTGFENLPEDRIPSSGIGPWFRADGSSRSPVG